LRGQSPRSEWQQLSGKRLVKGALFSDRPLTATEPAREKGGEVAHGEGEVLREVRGGLHVGLIRHRTQLEVRCGAERAGSRSARSFPRDGQRPRGIAEGLRAIDGDDVLVAAGHVAEVHGEARVTGVDGTQAQDGGGIALEGRGGATRAPATPAQTTRSTCLA